MKLIVAIVKPFKAQEIVDTLGGQPGVPGLTVLEGRGVGQSRRWSNAPGNEEDFDRPAEQSVILVGASETSANALAARLRELAHTGRPGDGKVFVLDLAQVLAITTDEEGDEALR